MELASGLHVREGYDKFKLGVMELPGFDRGALFSEADNHYDDALEIWPSNIRAYLG